MTSYAIAVVPRAICRGAGKWPGVHILQLNLTDACSVLFRRVYKLYLMLLHTCTDVAAQFPRRCPDGDKHVPLRCCQGTPSLMHNLPNTTVKVLRFSRVVSMTMHNK
jgi:hypothetical protein